MRHISTFEALNEVMSYLHDCPFDFDRVTFDKVAGTWSGPFLLPLWKDRRAEHSGLSLLWSRSRLPVAEVILTMAQVESVEVIEDQGIDRYTLDEVERTAEGIRFEFNEAMRIDIKLAGPIEATYEEKLVPGMRAVYSEFLLMQSGPAIETVGDDV